MGWGAVGEERARTRAPWKEYQKFSVGEEAVYPLAIAPGKQSSPSSSISFISGGSCRFYFAVMSNWSNAILLALHFGLLRQFITLATSTPIN